MKKFVFYLLLLVFLSGCSTKVVPKYVYVKQPCPVLETYEQEQNLTLTVTPKGNKVYIKEWKAFIPKREFKKLLYYINDIKVKLKKCNEQIKIYNSYSR